MRLIVFLSQNCFLAFVFLFGWAEANKDCDTKWIRLMYMLTCGKKKKRETGYIPDEVLENTPTDFEGALRYFRNHNPKDPIFMNETLLQEYLDKDNGKSSPKKPALPPMLLLGKEAEEDEYEEEWEETIELFGEEEVHPAKKLDEFENEDIRGFPEKWGLKDLMQKKTGIHQRSVDDLLEECCNVKRLKECTPGSFRQGCK